MRKVWILFIFVLFALSTAAQGQSLQIHFLDVGEGDSILIVTPNGKTALVDGGNLVTGLRVVKYLKKNGINELDHLIFTHPHLDHIGGAFFILQMLDIKNTYDNGEDLSRIAKSEDVYRWYGDLARKSNKYSVLGAGDSLLLGKVRLEVLWPPKPLIFSDFNTNSLVIMVEYGTFRCLLAGDSTSLTEAELLKKKSHLGADILKVGHHGCNDASSDDFLKAVSPKIAVISVNKDNIRDYPSQEVLTRLEETGTKIYRTDKNGNIIVSIEGDGEIAIKVKK
ncbi:MAG: MBL fold metallo-hydrolase [Candidatus Omnitrophica bacterium]|nr:MBL fold metallo-hydrolase [Candidatus Omnitrophota bacterium]